MSNKTDRQKVLDLFAEFGVEVTNSCDMSPADEAPGHNIWLNVDRDKIDGYGGFSAVFIFDDAESFVKIDISES